MKLSGLAATVVGKGSRAVHECRRCGSTLRSTEDACSYCGPTDVVTYELT
jgi:ribosomal protein L37E